VRDAASGYASTVASPARAVVTCDDEPGNRLAFAAVLGWVGYDVIAASDAADAAWQLHGQGAALILLRIKTIRTARDDLSSLVRVTRTTGVPVVAVSSNICMNELALEAAGFRGLIRIPAAAGQIELSVRRTLELIDSGASGWIRLPPPHGPS
jgi:CheY-like chemotaxis protein